MVAGCWCIINSFTVTYFIYIFSALLDLLYIVSVREVYDTQHEAEYVVDVIIRKLEEANWNSQILQEMAVLYRTHTQSDGACLAEIRLFIYLYIFIYHCVCVNACSYGTSI